MWFKGPSSLSRRQDDAHVTVTGWGPGQYFPPAQPGRATLLLMEPGLPGTIPGWTCPSGPHCWRSVGLTWDLSGLICRRSAIHPFCRCVFIQQICTKHPESSRGCVIHEKSFPPSRSSESKERGTLAGRLLQGSLAPAALVISLFIKCFLQAAYVPGAVGAHQPGLHVEQREHQGKCQTSLVEW